MINCQHDVSYFKKLLTRKTCLWLFFLQQCRPNLILYRISNGYNALRFIMFLVRSFLIDSSERFIETIFMYILHSRYYWPHHQNQHQHIIDCYNWDHHCVWSNHSLVQHQCLPSRGPTISSLLFWTVPDNWWWWWWWNFKLKKNGIDLLQKLSGDRTM